MLISDVDIEVQRCLNLVCVRAAILLTYKRPFFPTSHDYPWSKFCKTIPDMQPWGRWSFMPIYTVAVKLNQLCWKPGFNCSVTKSHAAPWTAACRVHLSSTVFRSLLKLMSIESVMLSQWQRWQRCCHLTLCHSLLLLPSIFPSIRVSSNESAFHIRWPKYWSFSISPTNEYSGLVSGLISLLSKGLSRVFSSTTVWKHQFFIPQPSLWSNSHIHICLGGPVSLYGMAHSLIELHRALHHKAVIHEGAGYNRIL